MNNPTQMIRHCHHHKKKHQNYLHFLLCAAISNHRFDANERGFIRTLLCIQYSVIDGIQILVTILNMQYVPIVCLKSFANILSECQVGASINLNAIVIIN